MTIGEALKSFLAADTAVTALVGTSPARIFPTEAAQGQGFPRVTYRVAHTEDEQTLRVSSDQPTVKLELSCWASSGTAYGDAHTLALAVKNSLGGGTGLRLKEFGPGTLGSGPGVWVHSVRLDDEYDLPTKTPDAGERQVQRVVQDYTISFKEQ